MLPIPAPTTSNTSAQATVEVANARLQAETETSAAGTSTEADLEPKLLDIGMNPQASSSSTMRNLADRFVRSPFAAAAGPAPRVDSGMMAADAAVQWEVAHGAEGLRIRRMKQWDQKQAEERKAQRKARLNAKQTGAGKRTACSGQRGRRA